MGFDNCRVKWLIYNAASLVAFAESIVASQDHGESVKMKQTAHSWQRSEWKELSASLKREKTSEWEISHSNFTLPGLSELDEIPFSI